MKRRHQFLFSLGLCLVLTAAATSAPPISSPSHRDLPDKPLDPTSAEVLLARRLSRVHDMNNVDDRLQNFLKDFKPENLTKNEQEKLQEIAKGHTHGKPLDPNDPAVAKIVRDPKFAKLLEKLHDLKQGDLEGFGKLVKNPSGESPNINDPKIANYIRKLVEKQISDSPGDTNLEELLNHLPKLDPTHKPDATSILPENRPAHDLVPPEVPDPDQTPAASMPPTLESMPNPEPPSAESSWLNTQLLSMAESVADWDGGTKDSLSSLLTNLANGVDGKAAPGTDFFDHLSKMGNSVPTDKVKDAGSWFAKMKAPSLPNLSPLAPAAPDLSAGGSGARVEGMAPVILGALGVLLVGLVVWKLCAAFQTVMLNKVNDPWQLGAWPVPPSAVRTRADLVKAFEYLAVLCLGPAAQTQNHLELGAEIGRQAPVDDARRAEAANTLAHLYEIARYSPADDTLPPEELATARRELSFLAGAASA